MVSWSALARNSLGQCNVPPGLGSVVSVAAGKHHTCAVKSNGELVCFGCFHTCAVKSTGELVCFGRNSLIMKIIITRDSAMCHQAWVQLLVWRLATVTHAL
eukprot:TRINITY_DN7792_c0_g1_i13.p1 TRINITY_DN7792_c0_g1~~TRINITY_DN7792_c0_g1_i13.p1  ORF type:complete len:101 (+),score=6.48 TRINITY_DN7792_c0_g1_i13:242-544(+)